MSILLICLKKDTLPNSSCNGTKFTDTSNSAVRTERGGNRNNCLIGTQPWQWLFSPQYCDVRGGDVINVKLQLRLAKGTSCVGYLCLSGTNECVTLMKIHLVYQEKKHAIEQSTDVHLHAHILSHASIHRHTAESGHLKIPKFYYSSHAPFINKPNFTSYQFPRYHTNVQMDL